MPHPRLTGLDSLNPSNMETHDDTRSGVFLYVVASEGKVFFLC